jgi:hypothetical protein
MPAILLSIMNPSHSSSARSPTRKPHARVQLSPLLGRIAQNATLRTSLAAGPRASADRRIWSAHTLTPPTPSLVERWWNPHVIDRLQPPLTRIRE